jgi:hypothetical protein
MLVWILEDTGDCEQTTLVGIYSTRQRAVEALEKIKGVPKNFYEISFWEVDS